MNLWIRSQDGNKLFNVHELYIRERTQPKVISTETKSSKFEILGNDEIMATYSSRERALEILDEIMNSYTFDKNFDYEEADLFLKGMMLPKIYEMPKE